MYTFHVLYIIKCGHAHGATAPVFTQFPISYAYNRSNSWRIFQECHVKVFGFLDLNYKIPSSPFFLVEGG